MSNKNKLQDGEESKCTDLFSVSDDEYRGKCGTVLRREYGVTPNGNPLGGRWVFRGPFGDFIDFDQYVNDLVGRYDLNLLENAEGQRHRSEDMT